MIRAAVLPALAAMPAAAGEIAGPDAQFDGGRDCRPHALGIPCWLDCLAGAGASATAVAFAAHLAAPRPPQGAGYDLPGVLVDFAEQRAVDVGTVVFPDLPNSNEQMLFPNVDLPVIHPYEVLGAMRPADAASGALLARHPQAIRRAPATIGAHRRMADGTQRFVIRDDCVAQVEFLDGTPSETRVLGYIDPEAEGTDPAPAIVAGDVCVSQFRLNLAGYAAGGMDGRAGPQAQAALDALRADHCPAAIGPVGEAVVAVTLSDGASPPPCP